MQSEISFILDGQFTTIDFRRDGNLVPTTTVLNYLRQLPSHRGVKEGCAEGDCGACTVVLGELRQDRSIRYRAVDSCLVLLPMIHRKQLITVENLAVGRESLHPVQQAMVETNGSQCGYCTPGFIMSLFSLYKNSRRPTRSEIEDALTGNLCRCTGYKPIIEAAATACVHDTIDQFTGDEQRIADLLSSIEPESLHLQTDTQQYFRPLSLGEAIALKHRYAEAILIGGATDVALRITKKHEVLKTLIDISAVDELQTITEDDASLSIGAGVVLSDVMPKLQSNFPALYDILRVFGSQQIRNLATMGGNLGTASPIGDTLPVLMAYNARVILEGLNGQREVSLDQFFTGYRTTARKSDEVITRVIIPKVRPHTVVKSYKVSKRRDLDIATVSAGLSRTIDDRGVVTSVVLAYGGMAEKTRRASAAEQFLTGKIWHRPTIEEAMICMNDDFTPISDARAGAEMRSIVARNLLLKFWSDTSNIHS